MSKNKEQILKRKEYIMNNFDEDDDVILPDTIFGELYLIIFVLFYMLCHPKERQKEWKYLKRQIRFFRLWMKNK